MKATRARSAACLVLALAAGLGACPSDSPECTTDEDCDREKPHCGLLRTCVECFVNEHCDDGVYCNGAERCRSAECSAGTRIDCSGVLGCASCDEERRACVVTDADEDGDGADSMSCGGTDCDDADRGRTPGRPEICDADDVDEDCDPTTYGNRDSDGDGHADALCCNEWPGDVPRCGDDCDDTRADTHPGSVEACDGRDTDCDGAIDEALSYTVYPDGDGDGFGRGRARDECIDTPGWSLVQGDCDDGNPQIQLGSFRCAGGSQIDVCVDDGVWLEDACPGGGECVAQPDGTGVCLPGAGTECSDGSDNDSDGLVDWEDPNCASPDDDTEAAARCADGSDNDNDLAVDYPADPGCNSTEDTTEGDPATPRACSNGIDDDSDGTVDWSLGAGDPGCAAASDDSERDPDGPQCDNGIDDDMDDALDGTDCCSKSSGDLDCASPADDSEGPPACANGLDDDGDGLTDFSDDPGCADATDESERGANALCDNGFDDDGDGASDFPGDSGCTGPTDATE